MKQVNGVIFTPLFAVHIVCYSSMSPATPSLETLHGQLLQHFRHQPTLMQERLFYAFSRFAESEKERCALLIKGYAGTGKTSSVSAMVNALKAANLQVVLLAPTGRAAKVLAAYSMHPAYTIHRQIYIRQMDSSGQFHFQLKENELSNTIFFVDEASMIGSDSAAAMRGEHSTGDLLEDLITHIYSGDNCKLVLIGDTAQLPPVGSDQSPALDLQFLRQHFFLNIAELELTEVIRQALESGILANATCVRTLINEKSDALPTINANNVDDITVVRDDMQPAIEEAYGKYGKEETIIITRSNKRANLFNQQVRARILWHEEEINSGDRMMVLKNNYYWLDKVFDDELKEQRLAAGAAFIANGDTLRIVRVKKFEDRGNFRFCRATVLMVDYPELPEFDVLLNCSSIWDESASLSQEKMNELGNLISLDYPDITNRGQLRRAVFKDEYWNALQVKFAYAITCHKAQGGQWPCVFVDQGYITDDMAGLELNRWFYTAFTRAQEKLFLVGFEEK
ncbi:MAG: ATP-dependent RecD-like DNA helicase, partial [Flavobacteriales bacterium]